MTAAEGVFSVMKHEVPDKVNLLRQKIHDENYLFEAIERIAQVLSNEITGISGESMQGLQTSQSRRVMFHRRGR